MSSSRASSNGNSHPPVGQRPRQGQNDFNNYEQSVAQNPSVSGRFAEDLAFQHDYGDY